MSTRRAVAAPPVSIASIDDKQLQAALRPLFDAWNVRNGYAGNGEERFITKADIVGLVESDESLRSAIVSAVTPDGGGGGGGATPAKDQINYLSRLIFNDPLWITLGTNIEQIRFNITGMQTDLNTKSSQIQGNAKALNGLQYSIESFTSETDAILQSISTQFSATIQPGQWVTDSEGNKTWKPSGINFGAIQGEYTTWSNAFAAMAQKTEKVEARLDGCVDAGGNIVPCDDPDRVGVTIEQNMEAVADLESGLNGEYTLKIDAAGFVAGFGLAVSDEPDESGVRSRMYVRADRFAIGHPDTGKSDLESAGDSQDAVVPFIVQDGKVYIDQAIIARAQIDWAQIINAQIESAVIKELTVDKLIGGIGKFHSINERQSPGISVTKKVPGMLSWMPGSGWTKVLSRVYGAERYLKKDENGNSVYDAQGNLVYVKLPRTVSATVVLSIETSTDEGIYVQLRWKNNVTGGAQVSFVQNEESSNSTRVQVFAIKHFDVVPTTADLTFEIYVSTIHGKATEVLSIEGHVQTIYQKA